MARKTKIAVALAVAAPSAVFLSALVPAFVADAARITGNNVAVKSRDATILDAIKALWTACPDMDDYIREGTTVLGNGARGKTIDEGGERIVGTLVGALTDAKVDLLTLRVTMSTARKVFQHYGRQDVRDAAEKNGLQKAAKIAVPKAPAESGTDSKAPATSTDDSLLTGPEWVRAHPDLALLALKSWFVDAKDAIALGPIVALEKHLSGKTSKAA
jgi:hypothetical protein